MINTRIRPGSNMLITAARNVAVVALLDKLTRSLALAGQVVVIGSEHRLGPEAAPYLLPRLLQAPAHPGDSAWPHLAFLVYRALASMHTAAREAHAHVRPHCPRDLPYLLFSSMSECADVGCQFQYGSCLLNTTAMIFCSCERMRREHVHWCATLTSL